MKLTDERINRLWSTYTHILPTEGIINAIRAIEREAHKNGQEAMRERAYSAADNAYATEDVLLSIRALEIEEPK